MSEESLYRLGRECAAAEQSAPEPPKPQQMEIVPPTNWLWPG